jgi:2-polyprenyl-6-methoxyphenol hydroxylase-like FAD-dependent oxidoreductase
VDVRGAAVPVVKWMGLHAALRDAATQVREPAFMDARGARVGRVNLSALQGRDEVRSLQQDAARVEVTFERAAPRRFDLLIGADGLHSRVRQLAFGPEAG